MKLRPLILTDIAKDTISHVVQFAFKHPVPLSHIKDTVAGKAGPVGDNKNYTCVIPVGYRCCFSVEEQPEGRCRHLSVSVTGDGYAPNLVAVEALAQAFGFEGKLSDWMLWEETYEGLKKAAVNVLQPIK